MQLKLVLLALVAAVSAQNLADIPKCATTCITNGLPANCNLDPKCICSSASFINAISCCVFKACDTAGQNATLQYAKSVCDPVGVTNLPTAAGCTGAAATATGASGASSAMSSSMMSGSVTSSMTGTASTTTGSAASSASSVMSSLSSAASSAASSASSSASAASTSAGAPAATNLAVQGAAVVGAGLLGLAAML